MLLLTHGPHTQFRILPYYLLFPGRLSELDTPNASVPARTPTPPFSISKTIKRIGQPRQQSNCSTPFTPGGMSAYESTPYTSPSVEPAEQRGKEAGAGASAAAASPKGQLSSEYCVLGLREKERGEGVKGLTLIVRSPLQHS
eukprot:1147065-Pelagomonas_calceolata.AAC.3